MSDVSFGISTFTSVSWSAGRARFDRDVARVALSCPSTASTRTSGAILFSCPLRRVIASVSVKEHQINQLNFDARKRKDNVPPFRFEDGTFFVDLIFLFVSSVPLL